MLSIRHFALVCGFNLVASVSCGDGLAARGGSTGGSSGSTGGAGTSGASGASTQGGDAAASSVAGSAGSTNGGGSGGTGTIIPPPACEEGSTTLPDGAPVLVPGTWTDISPSGGGLEFGCCGGQNLTQGMAIVPCNPATLYVAICASGGSADYPKGVYRSTNAGTSWERILATDSPNHIRVDPQNPLNLYVSDGVAGGSQGFYRTTDGGVTWDHKTNMCDAVGISSSCGLNDLYDVAVDPTDFRHLLISFHSPWTWGDSSKGAGVLESTDGGDSWSPHGWPNQWGYGHSVTFLFRPDLGIGDANTWLVSIQNGGGRWRTTDAGESWNHVSDKSIVHGGGNLYYTAQGVIYASGDPHAIKSTDNGATWTELSNSPASIGLMGDGEQLYAAPLFGPTPIRVAALDNDNAWSSHADPRDFSQGPFEFAFDAANRILYSASNNAGVWALKLP